MSTLAEELPRQQARCRELLEQALSIGPAGAVLVAFLRHDLAEAERAAAAGDVVAMLASCQKLRDYKS